MLIGHEDSAALGVGPLRKGLVVVHALQVPDVAVPSSTKHRTVLGNPSARATSISSTGSKDLDRAAGTAVRSTSGVTDGHPQVQLASTSRTVPACALSTSTPGKSTENSRRRMPRSSSLMARTPSACQGSGRGSHGSSNRRLGGSVRRTGSPPADRPHCGLHPGLTEAHCRMSWRWNATFLGVWDSISDRRTGVAEKSVF